MKSSKLSGRYAKALHLFALEENQEESVYQDILFVQSVFKENRELNVVIESPIIVADKKYRIFEELFNGKISEITAKFLRLIIKKRREPALMAIFENFIQCYYDHHHIKSATLTTATQLQPALLNEIKTMLEEQTKSTILLNELIDEKIIGGVMVKVDDFFFDASIIGKINKLKTEFSQNLYQTNF